jgi:hypothetical protein
VLFDKFTGQAIADKLYHSGVKIEDCSGTQFYTACSIFKDYMDNCAAKLNDASWRIVRRKSAGPVDIAIGISMVVHILAQPIAEAKVYS